MHYPTESKQDDDLLVNTRGIHLKETGIHEEVKGFFLPSSPCVLIPAKTAQQLDAGSVTRGVVRTRRKESQNHFTYAVELESRDS